MTLVWNLDKELLEACMEKKSCFCHLGFLASWLYICHLLEMKNQPIERGRGKQQVGVLVREKKPRVREFRCKVLLLYLIVYLKSHLNKVLWNSVHACILPKHVNFISYNCMQLIFMFLYLFHYMSLIIFCGYNVFHNN